MYGLQVYRDDGSVKLDLTKQMPRLIGEATLQGDGQITSAGAGYPNNRLWYVVMQFSSPANNIDDTPLLRIDSEGKRIYWLHQVGTIIKYGVY